MQLWLSGNIIVQLVMIHNINHVHQKAIYGVVMREILKKIPGSSVMAIL